MRANQEPHFSSQVSISIEGDQRVIRVNGIPDHLVGLFPNRGNPNRIAPQQKTFKVPLNPTVNQKTRTYQSSDFGLPPSQGRPGPPPDFGIAVNGVLFDPGAAEFWQGNPASGWAYDALGGAVALGLDANHAHVQPGGKYHYHGLPIGLMNQLGHRAGSHSPLIGWAADGFPIYAQYGYAHPNDPNSAIKELLPAYRLRSGRRKNTSGRNTGPGGTFDGTFVNDYEFVSEIGDLDEFNGRHCVTPEFPDGTYAYFLTAEFPVVPRQNRGEPDSSFQKQRNEPNGNMNGPGRRPQGPPPGFGPPGQRMGPPGSPPPSRQHYRGQQRQS